MTSTEQLIERFIAASASPGGSAGNQRLLETLGWQNSIYQHVKQQLIDDGDCQSATSIYAWWLGLKLVFNTWWNTLAASVQDGERATREGEDATNA